MKILLIILLAGLFLLFDYALTYWVMNTLGPKFGFSFSYLEALAAHIFIAKISPSNLKLKGNK